jgi:hypothetical protein
LSWGIRSAVNWLHGAFLQSPRNWGVIGRTPPRRRTMRPKKVSGSSLRTQTRY